MLLHFMLLSSITAWTQNLGRRRATTSISSTISQMPFEKETVAIIGGGIAGLSCANALQSSGKFLPTVFDTGRLRPGGRCASRLPQDRPSSKLGDRTISSNVQSSQRWSGNIVDHAAQILTVPADYTEFQKQVDLWEQQNIVAKFPKGVVNTISNPWNPKTKQYDKSKLRLIPIPTNQNDCENAMYFGVHGMQSIPTAMARDIHLEQDVWVSPSNGVQFINTSSGKQRWEIKAKGKVLGRFDKLVIAHNGKCADRLMSTTPAKDLHKLLQVNFAPFVGKDGGKKMTLNSLYSLTFVVPKDSLLSKALPQDQFTCGFVKNHPNLRFLSCNTRKFSSIPSSNLSTTNDQTEVWTLLSSAKFGKAFKGPQENLPDALVEQVTGSLLESLEESLILPRGTLTGLEDPSTPYDSHKNVNILDSQLQLWGAGVPVNTWVSKDPQSQGFLYDAEWGVGACGDWLLEPSLSGAWESGRRLAQCLITSDFESEVSSKRIGLEGIFVASKAVDSVGIGSLSNV
jgi:predicted NAD/FAD-dependent oxidoreductase